MELLTPAETAEKLRISKEQLRMMRRAGSGPPWIQISPKIIRYDEDALKQWLKENRNGTIQTRKSVVVQIPGSRS